MSLRDERKQHSHQALLRAALNLVATGRCFSSLSLSEVAREAGLVPAAFYRHFRDMDALALELVDQTALALKPLIQQFGQQIFNHLTVQDSTANPANTQTQDNLAQLLQSVSLHPEYLLFLLAERYSGSNAIRQAIAREIDFLQQDLCHSLTKNKLLTPEQNDQGLMAISALLVNLSLNWMMGWLQLNRWFQGKMLQQQQQCFMQQTSTQIQLLRCGLIHSLSTAT